MGQRKRLSSTHKKMMTKISKLEKDYEKLMTKHSEAVEYEDKDKDKEDKE